MLAKPVKIFYLKAELKSSKIFF